jgi:transposase
MRLGWSGKGTVRSFYVYKSAYVNGKRTTITVEKLGNTTSICEKYGVDNAEQWCRDYISKLNKSVKENSEPITVKFSPNKLITENQQYRYNVGYLFLQQIYYKLGLHNISRAIAHKYNFEYDLNSIFSRLVYSRVLYPASKLATCERSKKFVEPYSFETHQVYRALSVIAAENDYIQSHLYKNSLNFSDRKTGVIFYDCTNFFYEIEQEDDFRRYGVSKEHRPNPIVQMGLFMDREGIPLAFVMNPGNTNEQLTLQPLEEKLMSDFHLSKFVVCTDAGLSSESNRKFNSDGGKAFVTTQSIKKLKKHLQEWALSSDGWKLFNDKKIYNIQNIEETKHKDSIFFKDRWINENGFEQHLIVTYSLKTRDYQRAIRNKQIERAKEALATQAAKIDAKRQTDYKRFLSRKTCTDDGEKTTRTFYELNEATIKKEEKYDGFYGTCTNLEDDATTIVKINQRRWEIEECFRIMKSEFNSRPVYLSREDRIKAHFMTCFISLIIYRFLEKELGEKYTCPEIIDTLRSMDMVKIEGQGWIPAYRRTELTNALHEKFGFRTDYEILTPVKMKKICADTKKQKTTHIRK